MSKPGVRVSRDLGPRFFRAVEVSAAKKIERLAQRMADDIVEETNRIIEEEFVTDRPSTRRKGMARHLKGSIRVDVDNDGSFPVRLTVRSLAEKQKVKALEEGAGGHVIRAANAENLVFPSTKGRASNADPRRPGTRARRQAYGPGRGPRGGKPRMVVTPEVYHPGNKPYRFMQRALDRVVRRYLRR